MPIKGFLSEAKNKTGNNQTVSLSWSTSSKAFLNPRGTFFFKFDHLNNPNRFMDENAKIKSVLDLDKLHRDNKISQDAYLRILKKATDAGFKELEKLEKVELQAAKLVKKIKESAMIRIEESIKKDLKTHKDIDI